MITLHFVMHACQPWLPEDGWWFPWGMGWCNSLVIFGACQAAMATLRMGGGYLGMGGAMHAAMYGCPGDW